MPNFMVFYAFFWGFASFIPYPAIPIGNTVGLQVGQILVIPLFVIGYQHIKQRHLVIWLLLLFAGFTSLLMASLTSVTLNMSVGWLSLLARSIFSSAIVTTGMFLPNFKKNMILGIAVATIVHACIGFYQAISFQNNVFPFQWIYYNPSFGGYIDPNLVLIAKRPFGLFPEPSATAASIGPWLIYFAASMLKYIRISWTKSESYLINAAFIGGILLIMMSHTGAEFYIFPCVMFLFVRKSFEKRKLLASWSFVFAVVIMVMIGIFFIAELVESRLSGRFSTVNAGGSWYSRMDSIVIGLGLLFSNIGTFISGIGPGQGIYLMGQHSNYVAIWSVFFNSIVENGFLGIMVWAFLLGYSIRAVMRCRERITGILFFVVWFLGITISTSYAALLPIWVSLAALLSWDREEIGFSEKPSEVKVP